MIKWLKWLFKKSKMETSTLSDPASMSDHCKDCQNTAPCCQSIGEFQRNEKNDGEL